MGADENIAWKIGPLGRDELFALPLCIALERQEGGETLPFKVARGDARAIGLELCKKPWRSV